MMLSAKTELSFVLCGKIIPCPHPNYHEVPSPLCPSENGKLIRKIKFLTGLNYTRNEYGRNLALGKLFRPEILNDNHLERMKEDSSSVLRAFENVG